MAVVVIQMHMHSFVKAHTTTQTHQHTHTHTQTQISVIELQEAAGVTSDCPGAHQHLPSVFPSVCAPVYLPSPVVSAIRHIMTLGLSAIAYTKTAGSEFLHSDW